MFLNSEGRRRKGNFPAFGGVVSPSSSDGYAEGYAEERGVVAALSTSRGTTISLRFNLLIMMNLDNRFQVSPANEVGGLVLQDATAQRIIGQRTLEVNGFNR